MEWINYRNPKSQGMYFVRCKNNVFYLNFGYFDGVGWIVPPQVGDPIVPYRSNPEWSVIDWGKDGMD